MKWWDFYALRELLVQYKNIIITVRCWSRSWHDASFPSSSRRALPGCLCYFRAALSGHTNFHTHTPLLSPSPSSSLSLLQQRPLALPARSMQMQSMRPHGLYLKKQVMNTHRHKGKFNKGPGEFFFSLLQQIVPLTRCSQLHGTGEKTWSSAAIR